MKKFQKNLCVIAIAVLAVIVAVSMFACKSKESEQLNFGAKYVALTSQADTLKELKAKTADVAVMDKIMAGYYMNSPEYKDSLMVIDSISFEPEQYGIAARKGAASTINRINNALIDLAAEGKIDEIAGKYGLTEAIIKDFGAKVTIDEAKEDKDWAEKVNGELIVGYTEFAPIAYEENKVLQGFDIDLAKAVIEKLGITVKFQLITWEAKETELSSGNIDVIWNGMTITEERKASMEISKPYMNNAQVVVIRIADKNTYKTLEDMAKATIIAEAGSAGEAVVKKDA